MKIKKILLVLMVMLSISLLGCEVVCPECAPPEITVTAPNVTVTPEINMECPEAEVTIELDPQIDVKLPEPKIYLDVEIPEIESPEVNVSVKVWPYEDPSYSPELLDIAMRNHLERINYYKPIQTIDKVVSIYKGNGKWLIRVKWLSGGKVSYGYFVFSEWTDRFVE